MTGVVEILDVSPSLEGSEVRFRIIGEEEQQAAPLYQLTAAVWDDTVAPESLKTFYATRTVRFHCLYGPDLTAYGMCELFNPSSGDLSEPGSFSLCNISADPSIIHTVFVNTVGMGITGGEHINLIGVCI